MSDRRLSPSELRQALQAIGDERYHNLHPFHRALHDGALTRGQVQEAGHSEVVPRRQHPSRRPLARPPQDEG